jgi:DNA-binding transcriptional regulator YbjK
MTTPRAALIADTAIAVIAERGLRGLTHRAVDEAAGLPSGSTSNHARTRVALLRSALLRIAERESEGFTSDDPRLAAAFDAVSREPSGEALVEIIAAGLRQALTTNRALTLARFELALEANRRPELRELYDRTGAGFGALATELLARAGVPEPSRQAPRLVRWCEGVLFYTTVGAGGAHVPELAELRADVARYLAALRADPDGRPGHATS